MPISPAQCRAARGMLDWSRDELANRAHVGRRTVVDFEREARQCQYSTLLAIRTAFEAAGLAFTDDGGVKPRGMM
ncbi:XRE family transcriptional regulator [Ferruginivarius sediminum]|uniref:XRE family transcriptional regulator n=2 Tax=Ferruginivarius sediminum TaxID=2661937 RepID=A0A369TBD4_9PROT|nr:XRE family transcriptional regulator [Ferruginivarius sediminum]